MNEVFDVFLCHNSEDKPAILAIADRLKARGLKPWIDQEQLRPGLPWQRALEEAITRVKSAVVFVGKNGLGPWQQVEQDAFLRAFVNRACPVIPVLLDDAPEQPELPLFLQGMMWVDLRVADPDPFRQLQWGITGEDPYVLRLGAVAPEPQEASSPITESAGSESIHIEWPFESEVRKLLETSGATITLRGHSKVGKSSLLLRLHRWGVDRPGCVSCYFNFHGFSKDNLASTPKLLRALADEISNELDSQNDVIVSVDNVWNDNRSAQQNLTRFVEAVLDVVQGQELQLLFDDADVLFEHGESSEEFFKLLRAWHEKRKSDLKGRWKRLDLVIAHSTDPSLWITDINNSPFNVGNGFRLEDFAQPQVQKLYAQYCASAHGDDVAALMKLVGGHPYLLRLAFKWMANEGKSLRDLNAIASHPEGPFADVLTHITRLVLMEQNGRLRDALKNVLATGVCSTGQHDDPLLFQKLCMAGVLTGDSHKSCRFRNEVYRQHIHNLLS